MRERTEAFDATHTGLLDRIIWTLRTKQVVRHLPRTVHDIADLGCGRTAPLLGAILAGGHAQRAVGVDLVPDFRAATETLQLVQADLNRPLPFEDASFDAVLSLALIEHLTEPDLYLREANRILRPGGVLLLTTPSPLGKPVLEFLAFRLGVIDRREIEDHKQYFSSEMLHDACVHAGFASDNVSARTFMLGLNNILIARK